MATAKVQSWLGRNGQGYFHVQAANGSIVDQSEGYKGRTPAEAVRNAELGAKALIRAVLSALAMDAGWGDELKIERLAKPPARRKR